MYNSLSFVRHHFFISSDVCFLYYLWLKNKFFLYFFFFFNIPFLGFWFNRIFFSNSIHFTDNYMFNDSFFSEKLSFFFLTESRFFQLPKSYMSLILNVRSKKHALKLVTYWVKHNLLLLPEWKFVLSSGYSFYTTLSCSNFFFSDFFYLLKKTYVSFSSFSFFTFSFFFTNIITSKSYNLYFFFLKFFLSDTFFFFLSSFLFLNKFSFFFGYIYYFFYSIFYSVTWNRYFFSFSTCNKFLLFCNRDISIQLRDFFSFSNVFSDFSNLYKKSLIFSYKRFFLFNIFLFSDKGSFPYNGCRVRNKF